jgi:hypothetical protein
MANTKVFLIHGIGKNLKGEWSKPVIEKLKTVSKQYEWYKNNPIENHVDFIEICYDDKITELIELMSNKVNGVSEAIGNLNPDLAEITKILGEGGEADTFYWNNLADVLIYRGVKSHRNYIRNLVVEQLFSIIEPNLLNNGLCRYIVLAHSMGTMVAHDAIYSLMYDNWGGKQNWLQGKNFKFDLLAMLANTGRLLQTDYPKGETSIYNSPVRPRLAVSNYRNFNNQFDPLTWAYHFEPNWTGRGYLATDIRHLSLEDPFSIHDFEFYLDNPKVHIPILNSLVPFVIDEAEENNAINNYSLNVNRLEDLSQQFKDYVAENQDKMKGEMSVFEVVKLLIKFFNRH